MYRNPKLLIISENLSIGTQSQSEMKRKHKRQSCSVKKIKIKFVSMYIKFCPCFMSFRISPLEINKWPYLTFRAVSLCRPFIPSDCLFFPLPLTRCLLLSAVCLIPCEYSIRQEKRNYVRWTICKVRKAAVKGHKWSFKKSTLNTYYKQ